MLYQLGILALKKLGLTSAFGFISISLNGDFSAHQEADGNPPVLQPVLKSFETSPHTHN
jgi:hypothetical protein